MTTKVLITGVAGFIGSNLLDYLISNTNWKIDGVDNISTGSLKNIETHLSNDRFCFFHQKCSDIASIISYKYIFHLAALPRIQPSFVFLKDHIEANVVESLHLLDLMIAENYFPRFIYSSSSAIYGTPQLIPTPETESIKCLSPYAFQKYEVERYLELLSVRYPLDYVSLRYFNPYGPRSYNPDNKFNAYSSVVGIFVHQKQNNLALHVTGDGMQKRDFVHVTDLARANYLAAIHPDKLNDAFNIGHGSTISVLELAKMISDKIEFIAARKDEAEITFADVSKARNLLNWVPIHNLSDYLSELSRP